MKARNTDLSWLKWVGVEESRVLSPDIVARSSYWYRITGRTSREGVVVGLESLITIDHYTRNYFVRWIKSGGKYKHQFALLVYNFNWFNSFKLVSDPKCVTGSFRKETKHFRCVLYVLWWLLWMYYCSFTFQA